MLAKISSKVLPALVLLAFVTLNAHAEGKLDIVGKFMSGGTEVDLATYTDGPQKVGLLGLKKDQMRMSVAFGPDEWNSLIRLWDKGTALQSENWQFVGSYKETDTKLSTLLLMTAGPGVQFIVVDPDKTGTVVLSKEDFDKFEADLRQVQEYLSH